MPSVPRKNAPVDAHRWQHTQGPLRNNNHFSRVKHGVYVYGLEQAEVLYQHTASW